MKISTAWRTTLIPFSIVSLLCLPLFRYHSNPDAAAYLRLAWYYQHGQFGQAVNGIWSPLISWLLVPLYALGLPWMLAFRLLNIGIAAACLHKLYRITYDFFPDLSKFTRQCLIVTFASQLLVLNFNTITPDLLALCLVFYLLYELLADSFFKHPIRTGILGGCMYLAKAYCFYFFIAVIGFYSIAWFLRSRPRKLPIGPLSAILLIFLLISGSWVWALHNKYGGWQLSSAAGYNYYVLNYKGEVHQPYDEKPQLMPLPYPQAWCLWEDPQAVYHLDGKLSDKNIPLVIWANLKRLFGMISNFYAGVFLLIPIAGYILFRNNKSSPGWFTTAYRKILLFSALYLSGYLLIFVEARYVWLILFTLLLFVFKCLDLVPSWWRAGYTKWFPALVSIYFLFVAARFVYGHRWVEKQENADIRRIVSTLPPEAHIATWNTMDLWSPGYLYNWHHYGGLAYYKNWQMLQPDLDKYKIDFIIIKEQRFLTMIPADILSHMVLQRTIGGMSIYTIKK
ncbi:MAG TPA: hypothetical protein VI233_15985 [Puia sp.]